MPKTKKTPPPNKRQLYPKPEVQLQTVQSLFAAGAIKTFKDIFLQITPTRVADHLKINHKPFKELVENPEKFSESQLQRMADYLGIPFADLQRLVMAK